MRDLDYAQIGADKHGLAVLDDEGRLTLAVVKGLEQASKTGYLLSELPISSNVDAITFFEPESCYVVAASDLVPYEIASPPDQAPLTNGHKQHGPFPQVAQSTLKLFSSDDWTLIDEHPFEPFEQVTSLQTMHLLTSESFPTTSPFIVASTSRPPPNPATPPSGTLYIFTIAPTIPHPAYPAATHLKLKLILADAEIQPGAITSLHQLGSGFVGSVHGQKLIVRGFKADGSFLPVAFYDLPGYNPVLKVLPGPALAHGAGNLLAFADLMRGVQLVAFSEDPFRMTLAGRDPAAVPVASVEFLPHGRGLFLLAQDLALNLHLLQYKPEDARSSGGARLVRQAVFYVGQRIVDMQLLPRMSTETVGGGEAGGEEADGSEEAMEVDEDPATVEAAYHVLVLQASGSLALITPIPEQQHRRMAALQSQLLSALEPVAGLSHKAYRAARDVKIGPGEAQALGPPVMLDGNVLKKWRDIGRDRLGEIERAIGMDVEEIEAAIWDVSGGGLLLE